VQSSSSHGSDTRRQARYEKGRSLIQFLRLLVTQNDPSLGLGNESVQCAMCDVRGTKGSAAREDGIDRFGCSVANSWRHGGSGKVSWAMAQSGLPGWHQSASGGCVLWNTVASAVDRAWNMATLVCDRQRRWASEGVCFEFVH